jgi:hypothetical protein
MSRRGILRIRGWKVRGATMAERSVSFRPNALVICCTDHHRSAKFYEGMLGATWLPGDGYGCPWLRLGPWELSLMPNATEGSAGLLPAHAATLLTVEADDLAAAYRHCLRVGVQIVEPPNGPYMVIADPDGLEIEVWQTEEAADNQVLNARKETDHDRAGDS